MNDRADWRIGRAFTLYRPTTSDWPGCFVVRPFDYWAPGPDPKPGPFVCVVRRHELNLQRSYFDAHGLTNLGRQDGDDAVIAETWI
jgi:hypothetical protein